MTKHYIIGGSTAERTLNCARWYLLAQGLPAQSSNVAAEVGTLCHNAMEEYYSHGIELDELVNSLEFAGHVLNEMHVEQLIKPAIAMVEAVVKYYDIDYAVFEQTHEFNKNIGGTADILGLSRDRETVFVIDYKFGSHYVKVDENKQLYTYAFLARYSDECGHLFKTAKRVAFIIIQPKISKNFAAFETTIEKIDAFALDLLDAELDLFNPKIMTAKKGDWCNWCPAKIRCDLHSVSAQDNSSLHFLLDPNKKLRHTDNT